MLKVTETALVCGTVSVGVLGGIAGTTFLGLHPFLLIGLLVSWHLTGLAALVVIRMRRNLPALKPIGAILVLLAAGCVTVQFFGWLGSAIYQIDENRRILLHEINRADVLNACRQVMKAPGQYRQLPDNEGLDHGGFDPGDPSLPEVLRRMHLDWIHLTDQMLVIGYGGGFDSCCLYAFPPGVEGFGTLELLPGLWFYESDRSPRVTYPLPYQRNRVIGGHGYHGRDWISVYDNPGTESNR